MTAERHFLREALLALGSDRPGLREAARAVGSWDRALSLARAAWVAESVWAAATFRTLQDEVPESARSAFEEAHVGATARNALLLSEAAGVQSALATAGIESIVLKGPGLLVAHYPDIGARHVGDVDLLVRERDSARACEIVRSLGAREREPLLRYDGSHAEHAEPGEVHSPLVYSTRGVAIEMHQAQPGEARGDSDFDGLLARSRAVAWQGRVLRIPSAADLAAGACMHILHHHDGREKLLLRLLGDLSVTVGAGSTTWDEVRERMAPHAGRTVLETARRLLEEGPARGFPAWRHAVAVRSRHWGEVFAGHGRSPASFARILFPAREYMAARYQMPGSSPVLPLLYLWRPVRGIWSLLTGR